MCIIDKDIFLLIDYFNQTDGQPMLGIIQVRKDSQQNIQLPSYIKVYREITDEKQYFPEVMCKEKYYMDEKDKEAVNK